MKNLHWLPVKLRIKYKLCVIMIIHTQQCPEYMDDTVSLTASSSPTYITKPGLRSASGVPYRKPKIRTKFGERAFSYSGPDVWNCIPEYLQMTTDTYFVERFLKTFLFSCAHYLKVLFVYAINM
jgi:hypothetical protein